MLIRNVEKYVLIEFYCIIAVKSMLLPGIRATQGETINITPVITRKTK